jgi:hypothetical protein
LPDAPGHFSDQRRARKAKGEWFAARPLRDRSSRECCSMASEPAALILSLADRQLAPLSADSRAGREQTRQSVSRRALMHISCQAPTFSRFSKPIRHLAADDRARKSAFRGVTKKQARRLGRLITMAISQSIPSASGFSRALPKVAKCYTLAPGSGSTPWSSTTSRRHERTAEVT